MGAKGKPKQPIKASKPRLFIDKKKDIKGRKRKEEALFSYKIPTKWNMDL